MKNPKLELDKYRPSSRARFLLKAIRPDDVQGWDKAAAKARLNENLASKHWKFNPDDLKERAFWNDYMQAYEEVLRRCSKKYAPWYVVPAEHKWFRTMVVSELIRNVLKGMDPRYPAPALDPNRFDPDSLV